MSLLTRQVRAVLDYSGSRLAIDPRAPFTLSIAVVATPGEARADRSRVAVWMDIRILAWTLRDLGPYGKARVPIVLWESATTWLSTKRKLRQEVLASLRSHIRALDAAHAEANLAAGK